MGNENLALIESIDAELLAEQAAEYLRTQDQLHQTHEEKKEFDDLTTWAAETLDGNMRTEFGFTFDGQELFAHDGRPLKPIFEKAITDAEELANKYTFLNFETRRRKLEDVEYDEMIEMAGGDRPNTMIVISDFPPELMDYPMDVGGYNVTRKQTMLRVITWQPDGSIKVQSQSLDMSDRDGLEAICAEIGIDPQSGELLGQRGFKDLDLDEQAALADKLTNIYDNTLTSKYGGDWYAGRQPVSKRNTYEFACQQTDLIDGFLVASKNGTISEDKLRYQFAAAMEARWQTRDQGVKGWKQNYNTVYDEMIAAGMNAQAQGKTYSGCGQTVEGTDADQDMDDLGYGNKTKEMHCPFCNAKNVGDPCSPNQKCGTCKAEVREGKVVSKGNGGITVGRFIADTLLSKEQNN